MTRATPYGANPPPNVENTRGTILTCPQTAKNARTATKQTTDHYPMATEKHAITGSECGKMKLFQQEKTMPTVRQPFEKTNEIEVISKYCI